MDAEREREGATQRGSPFDYSLLFFCLRLKLRMREREIQRKARRDLGKFQYFNDPLKMILEENKGEWRMTERGVRGKIQRHRAKSKNIMYFRLFLIITA